MVGTGLVRGRQSDQPHQAPEALGSLELNRLRSRARQTALGGLERAAARFGRVVVEPVHPIPADATEAERELIAAVRPYTLTTPERIMALRGAVRYVADNDVPGDVVECGVWRGGSMIAAATTLLESGSSERRLWMYDTFDRMPPPDERDHHVSGVPAADRYDPEGQKDNPIFSYLPFEQVRSLIEGTGYPADRLEFVRGLVEETIPARVPDRIALCRLDTDWYRSTAHELEHLYPRISPGGVLIIDDYGEFSGARDAVDEYLAGLTRPPLLQRVDSSCRMLIVPGRADAADD